MTWQSKYQSHRVYDELNLSSIVEGEPLTFNKSMKNYSFIKGLSKGVVSFVLFLIPVLLTSNPAWLNLTVGGVLVIILNYLKFKYNQM